METLRLAGPIIIARSALIIMFTLDTMATGWVSSRELAFIGLGTAPQIVMTLAAVGMLQTVVVMIAQAIGAGETATTGRILRAGILHAVLIGLVICGLGLFAEPFFLATGQDPVIAAGAARVTQQFLWGVPGMLVFATVSLFLDATGRQSVGMYLMLGAIALDVPLNLIFANGHGHLVEPLGAVGAVGTSSAMRNAACLGALVYLVVAQRRNGDPHRVLVPASVWLAEIAALGGDYGRKVRRLGLPMGLAQGVESAAFATVVIVAGTIGPAVLAAHQVMMTMITLVYMLAIGMAGATAIRVGHAVGRGAGVDVARASFTGIGLGTLVPLPIAVVFIALPHQIGALFSADPAVLELTTTTLFYAGFLLAFDAAAAIVMGALRGQGDIWVPTLLQASAYWVFAVPLSFLLGRVLGYGALGLVLALFAGIFASIVLLAPRLLAVLRRPISRV